MYNEEKRYVLWMLLLIAKKIIVHWKEESSPSLVQWIQYGSPFPPLNKKLKR